MVVAITMIVIIAIVMLKKHKSNTKEGMKLVRGNQLPPIVDAMYQCPAGTVNISTAIGGEYPCISTTPNGSISDCVNNFNAGNWLNHMEDPNIDCLGNCVNQLNRHNIPHCDSPCVSPNICSPKSLKCVSIIGN